MKKIISLSIIIILTLVSNSYAMDQSTQKTQSLILHEQSGMQYKKNNFGDIFPQWQDIPHEKLSESLSTFVNALKEEIKETPFIIEVPHEKASALDAIKKAGFTFYHGNNDKTEWIFKNDSTIPAPYTSNIGGGVIIRKNDTVLVMQEKTRPQYLCTPGGNTDLHELARTAASRELKEEVNLTVNPDDLKLLAIINRTKANRFNANNACFYYTVDHSKISGELIPNPNEVMRAFYASLHDIAIEKPIDGLIIYPAFAALARHLLNTTVPSHHETCVDYRQISKKDSERNLNDTMTIEFIAQ